METGGLVERRMVVVIGLVALAAFLAGFAVNRSGVGWTSLEPDLRMPTPEGRVSILGSDPAVTAAPTVLMPTRTPTPTPTLTPTPAPTLTPTPRVTTKSFGFRVGARNTYEARLMLVGGSHLDLAFVVKENDIDFKLWLINPSLQLMAEQKRVRGEYRVSQTIEKSGEYLLWFDNSYSLLTDKEIALTYTVSEP